MKAIKFAALLTAAVMTMSAFSVTAAAQTTDEEVSALIESKIVGDDFKRTLGRIGDDVICRVVIEAPEEFVREHVDEKYPTSVYESDLLVSEATELFLRELKISDSCVYEYKNYVAAEIDVTKAELLELLKSPLIDNAAGLTLEQWEEVHEYLNEDDHMFCDPSDPHEHVANVVWADSQNFTQTAYYEDGHYMLRSKEDIVTHCRYCEAEMYRTHEVTTLAFPEYDKDVLFGENSTLPEETMLLMVQNVSPEFLRSADGVFDGLATAEGTEMCDVWVHFSYDFRKEVFKEEMLRRVGVFFDDGVMRFEPTQEELDAEAANWTADDEDKMQKSVNPEQYKLNTLTDRVQIKKANEYVAAFREVKASLGDVIFEKFIERTGFDRNKMIETGCNMSYYSEDQLASFDDYYFHADLTAAETIALVSLDETGYIAGETESQRTVREYEESHNQIDTDMEVVDIDENYPTDNSDPEIEYGIDTADTAKRDIGETTVFLNGIEDAEESLEITEICAPFTGEEKTLDVVIKDGGRQLEENTDYTVRYRNNVNVGTAYLDITGIGDYTGSLTYHFLIMEENVFAIKGDMDGDGEVTSGDALYLLRVSTQEGGFSEHDLAAGDLDGDGNLTSNDALIILRMSAGLAQNERWTCSGWTCSE